MPWEEGRRSAEFLLGSGHWVHFVPGVGGQRETPVIFIVIVGVAIIIIVIIIIIMAYQHIPTWWEYVIMIKGVNMTQSHSHHV